jgi:anti-anti-sigma factor
MLAPSFSYAVRRSSGVVVVTPHGRLDGSASAAIGDVLRDLIDNQGNLSVRVDLQHVTVADSTWIDVLNEAAGAAESRGGELSLAHPPQGAAPFAARPES